MVALVGAVRVDRARLDMEEEEEEEDEADEAARKPWGAGAIADVEEEGESD